MEGIEGTVIAPRKARAPGFQRFTKPGRDAIVVGNQRLNGERLGRALSAINACSPANRGIHWRGSIKRGPMMSAVR